MYWLLFYFHFGNPGICVYSFQTSYWHSEWRNSHDSWWRWRVDGNNISISKVIHKLFPLLATLSWFQAAETGSGKTGVRCCCLAYSFSLFTFSAYFLFHVLGLLLTNHSDCLWNTSWRRWRERQAEGRRRGRGGKGEAILTLEDERFRSHRRHGSVYTIRGNVMDTNKFCCDVIRLLLAIDAEEGLLCQSRDPQGWHGTRGNKGVHSAGTSFVHISVTSRN